MSAEELLEEARRALTRVEPHELAGLPDVLVVDIRPHHNRAAEGEIPGSIPVERIVLEWRLDPDGEHRIPGFTADTTVVVLCNEGYASSLAARDLQRVGLPRATDLVGGFRGYVSAGLPVRPGATQAVT
ncbi:sulfurtransferase [Saccharothrix sp. NRRL B-16348]|jgi:rhodanese-related sulfurtransferase|uniref:rhodanese-like domain-containing protein n=1 Tax=Saccharothrix sp. NRRL B-16348 TaxID=1415542 RepID=UPI0006AFC549|nr:rhodanese-like domain-containing protein [Saccharothrix sp. NRRL B-16348]KOX16209.1 sulfurtransferase [Saccharothrix sp. NRRL B-16348]